MGLIVSVVALAVVLGYAVFRPQGWTEAVVAVPVAVILVAMGAVSLPEAADEIARLLPVVGFLGTVLVLAHLCDDQGLFKAAGQLMARGSNGKPRVLLRHVFLIGATTTAVLSLDATVVLLTPVVLATAATLRLSARPHAYASAHLANTASLLLPVSNLTNLLAFTASGLSFTRFTLLMAAPWVVTIAVEYLVIRRFFTTDLQNEADGDAVPERPALPTFALVVLALTLAGFVVTSLLGIPPAWAALAGAVVLGLRGLVQRRSTVRGIAHAVNVPFLAFVLALGVVVRAVVTNGLDDATRDLLPAGDGLLALLALAAIAALLANVINNLPAVLLLLPLVTAGGAAAVLAVLVGVNVGSNLTYIGSLANLLWRRVLHREGTDADAGEFTRLGLCTVPLTLVAGVGALWAGLQVLG